MKPTHFRKPIAILLALFLIIPFCMLFFFADTTYAVDSMSAELTDVFNFRAEPKTTSTVIAKLPIDQKLTILDTVIGENVVGYGYFWYKITTNISGVANTGYIIRDVAGVRILDNSLAKQLSAFPVSYHAALTALHSQHPAWTFTALRTGYDWNYVLNSQEGKNAIWYSYPVSQRSLLTTTVNGSYGPSYDLLSDSYYYKDGNSFYFASRQTIAYYMDPRNFLADTQPDQTYKKGGSIFMFENLGYRSDQTAAGVENILAGTFMSSAMTPVVTYFDTSGNLQSTGKTYAQMIMAAAAYAGASAYFIAARMRMEIGVTPTNSVKGNFVFTGPDGTVTDFTGLYNYFNIYASDATYPGQNIANGLTYARDGELANQATRDKFMLPWTSPERSIMGGARYIAENYIRVGQDTLYLQKYSVNPATNKFSWHQYMSSVYAPAGESRSVYNSYTNMGILNNAFEFVIPVYEGMPDSPAPIPTETRSTNSLMTSLSVSGGTFSPGFAYDNAGVYLAYIDGENASITITGRKASLKSQVSIGSTVYVAGSANVRDFSFAIKLAVGENSIPMKITAENGTVSTYSLRIVRGIPLMGAPGFVARLFHECLNRDLDPAGFNNNIWIDDLQTGKTTGAAVAYGLVFSDEFRNRNVSDEEFITIMYRAFLNREPDLVGFNNWLSVFSNGMSRYAVLAGFINSNEFRTFCHTYEVNPGSLLLTRPVDMYPQITSFVTRFYKLCVNRMPDSSGLDAWVSGLKIGQTTGADVAFGFVFSNEFQNRNTSNEDFVSIMYKAFLNREPDPIGFNNWLAMISNGMSRYSVLAGFVNSSEFRGLCKIYGINPGSLLLTQPADLYPQITAFVTRFYKLCLNRMPDSTGLNTWVDVLHSGKSTVTDVAYGFVFSNEFKNRNVSNKDFITIMYKTFLNREPDAGGYTNWIDALNAGQSRQYVMAGFVNSSEFGELCLVYGINKDSSR